MSKEKEVKVNGLGGQREESRSVVGHEGISGTFSWISSGDRLRSRMMEEEI